MNISGFLTCLGYNDVATGTSVVLEGVYSSTSGTTGYFYNLLYPTGTHEVNGVLYGPVIPLANVGWSTYSGGQMNAQNCLRAGYKHNGNFSVLMDVEYSGCSGVTAGAYTTTLLSTSARGFETSGFSILINDTNRLVFKTLNKSYTLTHEMATRDMVYVSLTENQFVTMGLYSVADDTLYTKTVQLEESNLNTDSLYFGGQLSYHPWSTGFNGTIHNIMLFNDDLTSQDIGTCALCSLVSSYAQANVVSNFSGYQITGLYYSGFVNSGTTGYQTLTGYLDNAHGGTKPIIYQSGMSGVLTSGEIAQPLLSDIVIQVTGTGYNFTYSSGDVNAFTQRLISFDLPLTSGDVIEVYSYPKRNPYVNKRVDGFSWPEDTGFIQLVSNGLAETSGVDYDMTHNVISGFQDEDLLSYDVLRAPTIVTPWTGSTGFRVPIVSGGFFPPVQQYPETSTNEIRIQNLSGISSGNIFYPEFGYDLFMNGQKLISGIHYIISNVGGTFWVRFPSGLTLPYATADFMYDTTGGVTGWGEIYDNELTFAPYHSGFKKTVFQLSGDATNIGMITGFSEQVWVNGVRQLNPEDYIKTSPCSVLDSILDPPYTPATMYTSVADTGNKWNASVPPYLYGVTLTIDMPTSPYQAELYVYWASFDPYGYPNDSGVAELYFDSNWGTYYFGLNQNILDDVVTQQYNIEHTGFGQTGVITGQMKIRFVSGNHVGDFGYSTVTTQVY